MRQAVTVALLVLGMAACHKSCSYSGSTSVSYGTDAGALTLTSPVDAAAEASTVVAPTDGGLPHRFAGVFHLPDRSDEANLALAPGGTFRWRIFGCDFGHASCGEWTAKGNLVVLTPAAGARTMDWIDQASYVTQVTRVDVAEHGGRLELRAYLPNGTSIAQVWTPGHVCASCTSKTALTLAPCDDPFPSTCP